MKGTYPAHNTNPLASKLATAAAFLLPALSLSVPSGYSLGALLLVAAGILSLRGGLQPSSWPRPLLTFGAVVAAMACLWAADAVWREPMTANAMDRPLKYLLALLALPALRHGLPDTTPLRWGCWVGALSAGATAAWQVHILDWERAWGYTNAIQFGDLALLLALWSVAWLPLAARPAEVWVGRFAALAGLYAMVASGSRGAWLVTPVLVLLLALQWAWRASKDKALKDNPSNPQRSGRWPLMAIVLVCAILLASQWGAMEQRWELGMHEWAQFQQNQQSDNSVGQRLAHWQLAWHMGWERPWLGWGQVAYDAEKLRLVQAGQAPAVLLQFGHAHHEWLDMWVKKGLSGLVVLALFFVVPWRVYWRTLRRQPTATQSAIATCGAITVLGYLGFGMTQMLFAHNSGNVVFLFMNLLWLAALQPRYLDTPSGAPQ